MDEERIPHPYSEEISATFQELKNQNIKRYYTREIKRHNFLEIGEIEIHEDSLLTELHHASFNELKNYEISEQRMDQGDINCKIF